MTTVIRHNTFFQRDVQLTEKPRAITVPVQPAVDDYLRAHHIYTRFNSAASRFKVGTDQIRWGATASIEPYTTFGRGTAFYAMGSFSYAWSQLPVNTVVGRYTSIGNRVRQLGHNHPLDRFTTSSVSFDGKLAAYQDYLQTSGQTYRPVANPAAVVQPVAIGNDVLIGDDVVFGNHGVVVSDGAVVAAGSLVTHDVPPYAVVAGWPARIIKYRFDFPTIDRLLDLRWWQYDFGRFGEIAADARIEPFIAQLENLVVAQGLQPFDPEPVTAEAMQSVVSET